MPVRSESEYRVDIVAFFGALCLFLSTVEYLIPKPIPFIRLGIANLPILLGMRFLTRSDLLLVMLLKVLGQGFVNGTFASYVFFFSFSGSFTSLGVMLLVHYLCRDGVSSVGISLSGALASALMQIFLSLVIIFGQNAQVIAPYFLGSALLTGSIIGFAAENFAKRSEWLSRVEKRYRYLLGET